MNCDCETRKLRVRRGSTPTLAFCVDFDLTIFEVVRVVFLDGYRKLVKKRGDIELRARGGCTDILVPLTQEDTLGFRAGRKVEVQVRYRKGDMADATGIGELVVEKLLEEGAI